MLIRHGYGVLLFDRRGEGASEGDPNMFGWAGDRDLHAAVRYLRGRPNVDPDRIGGIGLSGGGEMLIRAAADSEALKAVVVEGASGQSVRDGLASAFRI
jgi:dienelactone hydrolase